MKRLIKELTIWTTNGNVDTSTYPPIVTWSAAFLYLMLAISLAGTGVYTLYRAILLLSDDTQVAAAPNSDPAQKERKPEEISAQGGAEIYTFTDSWHPKDDNSKINEDGSLSLKEEETSSIYEYGGVVPLRSDYGLSFVSRGVFGPNVVIGRPAFYEITVGDMSNKVITLKATNKLGGNLVSVEEVGWAKYKETENALRPRTENCSFIPGEEIKVDIVESFIESTSQFKVDVTVTCNSKKSDTFSWVFVPPPRWAENESLYFAIIDDKIGSNATKIDFLDPIILEAKERETDTLKIQ